MAKEESKGTEYPKGGVVVNTVQREDTRIRINFKVSAKGEFQPDITSEAETVETAMRNLDDAHKRLNEWAVECGLKS